MYKSIKLSKKACLKRSTIQVGKFVNFCGTKCKEVGSVKLENFLSDLDDLGTHHVGVTRNVSK